MRSIVSCALTTIIVFVLLMFSPAILMTVGVGISLAGRLLGLAMQAKPGATALLFIFIALLYGIKAYLSNK